MIVSYLTEDINRKLNEEIQVDGAVFIGNGNGFDVFQITTWQAASAFNRDGTDYTAGDCWIHSESNFTNYIHDEVKLFYFVKENTNKAVAGAIKTFHDNIKVGSHTCTIKLLNYSIDSGVTDESRSIPSDMNLPLYLLPELQYEGENCMGIHDGILTGTYNALTEVTPGEITIPESVHTIKAYAFTGFAANRISIETNITTMESNAFRDFEGEIEVAFESLEEAGWPSDWTNSEHVLWGSHLSDDEREARAEAERQRIAAEQERLRAEAEAREREEQERREREEQERIRAEQEAERQRQLQRAEVINVLRYKQEGKGITIFGCKRGRQELEIPEEINGKPVLKIAPFAFYENETLTRVRVPATVTEIGKGAFAGCSNAKIEYPKRAIVYRDALDGVRSNSPYNI